ncbi:MAG: ABC transporter permease subunit [Lachnospiraceae bacterium]
MDSWLILLCAGCWFCYGFIHTSGISGIPQELYEAAKIDGAGETKQFFYITVPPLRGTTYTLSCH